jgi:hypothetical protein
MVQVEQDLEPATNDIVRLAAFDIGHKPYAARIIFVPRVIETLTSPKPHPGYTFSISPLWPIPTFVIAAASRQTKTRFSHVF